MFYKEIVLPQILTSRLRTILGDDYDSVIHAFSSERIGSFRVNTLSGNREEVFEEFGNIGILVTPYEGITGTYLYEKKYEYAIKGSKAFYSGKIYLQSVSSLLPALALDVAPGMSVLDVCAAPGSKTTQISSLMQNTGHIIALEQNQIRYDKLLYNARLQKATIIDGKKMDARIYLKNGGEYFDRILLDAPCSAEGRISLSNEKSYGFWSLENIEKKAAIQYELLSLAVKRLSIEGIILYSTCTLAPEENEAIISRILKENPTLSLESIDLGLSHKKWWKTGNRHFGDQGYADGIEKTVRILPTEETEGFFLARLRRGKDL